MKERRYDIGRINQLAQEYVKTSEDAVFERLMLEELEPLTIVQLGKKYSNVKDFWEDMRQEVLLYLWKNRNNIKTTKSKNCYQFYYGCIRQQLKYISDNRNRVSFRTKNGRSMVINSYDYNNDNVMFFDELSLDEKRKLGIAEFPDEVE